MFENVDRRMDGRTTDAGVTGILIAHLGAFGSGELKTSKFRFAGKKKILAENLIFEKLLITFKRHHSRYENRLF